MKVPPGASGTLVNQVEVEGGGAPAKERRIHQSGERVRCRRRASSTSAPNSPVLTGSRRAPPTPTPTTTRPATRRTRCRHRRAGGADPGRREPEGDRSGAAAGAGGEPDGDRALHGAAVHPVHGANSKLLVNVFPNECPPGSAVGLVSVQQTEGTSGSGLGPIYNLVPPKGMPAQLGFQVGGQPIYINTKLRSDGDYGVTAYLHNLTEAKRVTAARMTIWGTPWDESHDAVRAQCARTGRLLPGGGDATALHAPAELLRGCAEHDDELRHLASPGDPLQRSLH